MNKAVKLKTHLVAELAPYYFTFAGPRASQGTLLEDWENGRELPVAKTGSLCFAPPSKGWASEERKVKVFLSRSGRSACSLAPPLETREILRVPGDLSWGEG